MHPDFGNFVFDGVYDIVQFKKHIYLDDAVVKLAQLFEFFVDVIYQLAVCIKMKRLNVYVHSLTCFESETIKWRTAWWRRLGR